MSKNDNLQAAKQAKNDEFYTQITDIEKECKHYRDYFKDKTIFCNCDDPSWSNFWRYFHLNFKFLGLKKLISTHYDKDKPTYKLEYTGGNDEDIEFGKKTDLIGNGDFRNQECIELLKEADIVITNPPFSLAREYMDVLVKNDKKFLIVGDLNWITYKEIFPLLKDDKIWLGYNNIKSFIQPDGSVKKFGNKLWYTNLDIEKRHTPIILYRTYNANDYHKYDNFDALNVDKVGDIPVDYDEPMGVPVTFFEKYCPEQFEILGNIGSYGVDGYSLSPAVYVDGHKIYKRILIKRR